MDNTIQLYTDEERTVKGYPLTSPDRVIDEDGVSIKKHIDDISEQLDNKSQKTISILDMLSADEFSNKIGVHYYDYHNVVKISNGTDTTSLMKIRKTGFRYVRFLIEWKFIEQTKGVYDFGMWDKFIDKLLEHDLIPFIYIGEKPNDGLSLNYEQTLTHFETFADVVTKRYKNKNIIWEIYNEPNINFWFDEKGNTPKDAFDYATMVKNVSKIIRKNDGTGKIVAGVIACANDYETNQDYVSFWSKYIEYICEYGVLNHIDYFSFHPYKLIEKPEVYIDNVHYVIKSILNKHTKREVPLIISEFGYTLTKISDELQAKYLCRALCIFDMLDIRLINVFNWNDTGTDKNEIDRNFGIIYNDGSHKKSYEKIKTLISELNGYKFIERLVTDDANFILKYCNNELNVKYVYWTSGENITLTQETHTFILTDEVQIYNSRKKYIKNNMNVSHTQRIDVVSIIERYGLGKITRELTPEDDLNDIHCNGVYYCSSAKNAPVPNCVIQNIGENRVWGNNVQIGYDNWSSDIYVRARRYENSIHTYTQWTKLINSNEVETHEENLTLENCQGQLILKAITVKDKTHVSIQGQITGVTIQNSGNTIANISEKYRTRVWEVITGVNASNWEDVNPMIQLVDDGKVHLLIRGTSAIKSSDVILFNISYIV